MDNFGSLGGIQTQGNNPTFSMVDPELHGGIMQILLRLKDDGASKNNDDIPYRAPVSREVENLLSAGGTISCGGFAQSALKYYTPTICMGQAVGAAAGLAVTHDVTPKQLDVKLL